MFSNHAHYAHYLPLTCSFRTVKQDPTFLSTIQSSVFNIFFGGFCLFVNRLPFLSTLSGSRLPVNYFRYCSLHFNTYEKFSYSFVSCSQRSQYHKKSGYSSSYQSTYCNFHDFSLVCAFHKIEASRNLIDKSRISQLYCVCCCAFAAILIAY